MAHRLDALRGVARERKNHRNVVRRKAPEHVFLAAEAAEVEAVGIDVMEAPEPTFGHQLLQPEEGRMVLEEMSHHDQAAVGLGGPADPLGILNFEREGLLDEKMLSCFKRLKRQRCVRFRGRRQHHPVNVVSSKNLVERRSAHLVVF